MSKVLVLGDGGWGTAIALTLHDAGHTVGLWSYDADYAREVQSTRLNPRFLPGIKLPESITVSNDIATLADGAGALFSVIPTQHLRATIAQIGKAFPAGAPIISCSKGIEKDSLVMPSTILREALADHPVLTLSGPSHAEEVSRRLPTTVVVASRETGDARQVQELFVGTRLRVYTSTDVTGVELGGAVKNVIAIASGISDGLGFGDNSRAAIVTRGLVEITRFGLALGAQRETFAGLSGMGDLITTCTSEHSRNRNVGLRIGKGEKLEDIVRSTHMVAEGVETTRSVHQLGKRLKVDMPITRETFAVLYEGQAPQKAVERLMSRAVKDEMEDLVV